MSDSALFPAFPNTTNATTQNKSILYNASLMLLCLNTGLINAIVYSYTNGKDSKYAVIAHRRMRLTYSDSMGRISDRNNDTIR